MTTLQPKPVGLSFKKSARILKRRDYLNFFNQSDVKRLGVCVVFRLKNQTGSARLGMTIKIKQGSVVRNKIKRQIREAFRLNHQNLGSFDYNVVVTPQIKLNHQSPFRIRQSLESIWSASNERIF